MIAIISLLIIVTLSILVTRVSAVALTHTGLSKEAAAFQARSAFTGVGFTTGESEQVVNHPVRRKILYVLMLLGNAGIISAISSLILSFISIERTGFLSVEVLVMLAGLLSLWILSQSKWIDKQLSYLIDRALNRYTDLDIRDYYSLLHLSDNYRVSEIKVEEDDWIADRTLSDMKLRDEGILVLGIRRNNGDYVGAPRGQTRIYPKDTLLLYGRASLLEKLDTRVKGSAGDKAHDDAVLKQEKILDKQREKQKKRMTGMIR